MTRVSLLRGPGRAALVVCSLGLGSLVAPGASEPSGAAVPPACTSTALSLSVVRAPSLASAERAVVLRVQNRSAAACVLSGAPSVFLRDTTGTALRVRYSATASPFVARSASPRLSLAPRASAYALLAQYYCTPGVERRAARVAVSLGGALSPGLSASTSLLGRLAQCRGPISGMGQLVGVSSWRASVRDTYATAAISRGTVLVCTGPSSWPTRHVSGDVLRAISAYYAAKKLTPATVPSGTEWVLNVVAYRVGTHWCLNADGGYGGYSGSVPATASAAVMVLVRHRAYPVTQNSSSFVTLAQVKGLWRVVGEGTGP